MYLLLQLPPVLLSDLDFVLLHRLVIKVSYLYYFSFSFTSVHYCFFHVFVCLPVSFFFLSATVCLNSVFTVGVEAILEMGLSLSLSLSCDNLLTSWLKYWLLRGF